MSLSLQIPSVDTYDTHLHQRQTCTNISISEEGLYLKNLVSHYLQLGAGDVLGLDNAPVLERIPRSCQPSIIAPVFDPHAAASSTRLKLDYHQVLVGNMAKVCGLDHTIST